MNCAGLFWDKNNDTRVQLKFFYRALRYRLYRIDYTYVLVILGIDISKTAEFKVRKIDVNVFLALNIPNTLDIILLYYKCSYNFYRGSEKPILSYRDRDYQLVFKKTPKFSINTFT